MDKQALIVGKHYELAENQTRLQSLQLAYEILLNFMVTVERKSLPWQNWWYFGDIFIEYEQ